MRMTICPGANFNFPVDSVLVRTDVGAGLEAMLMMHLDETPTTLDSITISQILQG